MSNATEKSVIFNDRNGFYAVLKLMKIDNSSINKMWKDKKIPLDNEKHCKVYTIQTLDAAIQGDVIAIYISNIDKIRNKSRVHDILVIPWNNDDIKDLKSTGAREI